MGRKIAISEGSPDVYKRPRLPGALKSLFAAAGAPLDASKSLVGTCGSGLTACVLALAVFKATGDLVRGDAYDFDDDSNRQTGRLLGKRQKSMTLS